MALFIIIFESYRLALRVLLSWMALHFVATTIGFLRRKPERAPDTPAVWPRVTVQLPIRDEYFTACRALDAVARLDYPQELLEIQVLDDSSDGTTAAVAARVSELRAKGCDVTHVQRRVPVGYKAGALQAGLRSAKGELIAMFDADFVPSPDFLRRTVPFFGDERVAMVQGGWSFLNREANWLTRLQAQMFDALFLVERTAKSRAGLPFQFNGTAGVWRRSAIDRAGGWSFDSLTEDLDLSIRVQLLGYRMLNLPDVRVPSELPTTLAAFRVQQRRWALGTAQLLRKRLLAVLRADLPLRARAAILMQLGRHVVHPFVMLLVVTAPITTLYWADTPIEYGHFNLALFAVLVLSIAAQHVVGAEIAGQSRFRAALRAPFVVPLALSLAPTYCAALSYGLMDRAGVFFRTPKITRPRTASEPEYRPRRSWLIVFEVAIGIAYVYFTAEAIHRGMIVNAAFLGMVCAAFGVMGLGSLGTRERLLKTREREVSPSVAESPVESIPVPPR